MLAVLIPIVIRNVQGLASVERARRALASGVTHNVTLYK